MADSKTIGLVTGGFDPVHKGHIKLIAHAYETCDILIVGLNSDEWLIRKKGNFFMTLEDRIAVMESMKFVHHTMKFNDDDDSACDAIAQVKKMYPGWRINFCNGGDRNKDNILEMLKYSGDPLVKFYFGVGGIDKKSSSSDLLRDWELKQQQTTQRNWGIYNVLDEGDEYKLKTLHVAPGQSLSMQKHKHRSEHWFVARGSGQVELCPYTDTYKNPHVKELREHELFTIPVGWWHKLSNTTDEDLYIIEIQYGSQCKESDIIRQPDK
jgi:cytidyltransferase-like protein